MENNDKKIQSIVDELLTPTNMKEYQGILNKEITEDESEFMDSWVKWIAYENKEKKVEEELEEVVNETSNEKPRRNGMYFEMPDLTKYEWKPPCLEREEEEEELEIDLLKMDIEDEVKLANAIIDRELLLDGLLGKLEETKEIMVSEKIRECLIEEFKYFPINVNEIAQFYEENCISLEIPNEGIYLSRYIIKIKEKEFKTFDVVLIIDMTDNGVSLSYKIIEY